MTAKHATCGGSSVARWLRCPGSVKLCATLPRTSSKAADRGTMLHSAMESVMLAGRDPGSLVSSGFSMNGQRLDHTDARKMLIPARHATLDFFKGAPYQMEVKVTHARGVWGTADLLGESMLTGYVADYKFGSGIVSVIDNEQIKFYASAALHCGKISPYVKQVRTAIIQPEAKQVLTQYAYTVAELQSFGIQVRAAAKVAMSRINPAPFIPGPIQCEWCPAKKLNVCPALKEHKQGDHAANFKALALRV